MLVFSDQQRLLQSFSRQQFLQELQGLGEPGVRTGALAKLLGKDKGDLVYWYDTSTEVYVKSKNAGRGKRAILFLLY